MFWTWCVWTIDSSGPPWAGGSAHDPICRAAGWGEEPWASFSALNLCSPFKETRGAATGFNSWCVFDMVFLAAFSLSHLHLFSSSCCHSTRTLHWLWQSELGANILEQAQMSCWDDGVTWKVSDSPFISALARLCRRALSLMQDTVWLRDAFSLCSLCSVLIAGFVFS